MYLFSCDVGGRIFHYYGYWNFSVSENIRGGVYVNNTTLGIGPMLTWGNYLAVSMGANPGTSQYGAMVMFYL